MIGIKIQCIDSSWNTVTKYKVSCVNEDDLFNYNSKEELLDSFKVIGGQSYSDKTVLLPTEGQLRTFIEDKTGGKVESYYAWDWYTIAIRDTKCDGDDPQIDTEETNLLQAYWKVVCKIANEMC